MNSQPCEGSKPTRHGNFTLIELIIVITIIAILAGLLLPALKTVKDKGRAIACLNNQKNLVVAVFGYVDDHQWLPHSGFAHWGYNKYPDTCWRALIAPYLGVDAPPNSQNTYVLEHGIFQCPSQNRETCGNPAYGYNGFYGGYGWNSYSLGLSDTYCLPPYNSSSAPWVKMIQLKKPSLTLMFGDTTDDAATFDCFALCAIASVNKYAARHNFGGNYAWGDGHLSSQQRTDFLPPNTYGWWKLE